MTQELYVVLGAGVLVAFPIIVAFAIFDMVRMQRWGTMYIGSLAMGVLSVVMCYATHLTAATSPVIAALVGIADASAVVSLVGLAMMIRGLLDR